jgi:hypothetical protein
MIEPHSNQKVFPPQTGLATSALGRWRTKGCGPKSTNVRYTPNNGHSAATHGSIRLTVYEFIPERREKPANAAGFPVSDGPEAYFIFEQSEPGHST